MPPSGFKPTMSQLKKLRALGVTCGIGSMLIGARQAGFDVVGNIEWRKYYHLRDAQGRNTFTENFSGAFFKYNDSLLTPEEETIATGCDIVLGHPECGAFSNLRNVKSANYDNPCDIPLFVELVAKFRPRFFVMDDLPPSFAAYPMARYVDLLHDYDLFPEWVSNYHYGNVQKHRKRMFMIGALKSERWAFVPNEIENGRTVADEIADLEDFVGTGVPNHDVHNEGGVSNCSRSPVGGPGSKYLSWKELSEWFRDRPPGTIYSYVRPDGREVCKFGLARLHWDSHSHVLHGGRPLVHTNRCYPLTIRERARIQGFPDDFVFYGTKFDAEGKWDHEKNSAMIKQTGKAMPVQFCRYVSRQIAAHCRGEPFVTSGKRVLTPNKYVDAAKTWYCANVGYADQEKACKNCWLYDACDVRGPRYGIGGTVVPEVAARRYELQVVEPYVQKCKVKRPRVEKSPATPKPVQSVPQTAVVLGSDSARRTRTVESTTNATAVMREVVESRPGRPADYHCSCAYCVDAVELIRPDATYYSRNDRKFYYSPAETATAGGSGHIAKTPLHVARWAIQQFTHEGDWVFDPTAGAGTTLVEAVVANRNAFGIEIQTGDVIRANVDHAKTMAETTAECNVVDGDARDVGTHLFAAGRKFALVVNNPPYSGDESQVAKGEGGYEYDAQKNNLAFLDESDEYYDTLRKIYSECVAYLRPGGRFVMAVKDQTRDKEPDQLHEKIGDVLASIPGLKFERAAVLNHYPRTLHLNTYFRRHGVHPPYYQSILVFRKRVLPGGK